MASFFSNRFFTVLFLFLLVFPQLVFIVADEGLWRNDPTYYAIKSIRLYQRLDAGFSSWWSHLLWGNMNQQPPLLTFVAQFFTPVGAWAGSYLGVFLLVVFGFTCLSVGFFYLGVRDLLGSRSFAFLACLMFSSAPLFFLISTNFFAEVLQLFVVSWCFFVFSRSVDWPFRFLALQGVGVVSAALLVKPSTLVYVVPLLAGGLWTNYRRGSDDVQVSSFYWFVCILVFSFLLVFCVAWYVEMHEVVFKHTWKSAMHPYKGVEKPFFDKFRDWLGRLEVNLLPPLGLLTGVLLFFIAGYVFLQEGGFVYGADLCGLVSVFTVLAGVSAHSLAVIDTERYLLPFLPFVCFIFAWLCFRSGFRWLFIVLWFYFLAQWVLVVSVNFGLADYDAGFAHRNFDPHGIFGGRVRREAELVVNVSCPPGTGRHFHYLVNMWDTQVNWESVVRDLDSSGYGGCVYSRLPSCLDDSRALMLFGGMNATAGSTLVLRVRGLDEVLDNELMGDPCRMAAGNHSLVRLVIGSSGFVELDSPARGMRFFKRL